MIWVGFIINLLVLSKVAYWAGCLSKKRENNIYTCGRRDNEKYS